MSDRPKIGCFKLVFAAFVGCGLALILCGG